MLANAFICIRGVHVLQGLVCLVSGWRAYRRPVLAAAVEAAAIVEYGALSTRYVRGAKVDGKGARIDGLFGLGGLVGLAAATHREDRTASLNWMLPLSVGSCLGLALGEEANGALLTGGLSVTYAATALGRETSRGRWATVAANAISYPGFFIVARLVTRFARRVGSELDDARHKAVEQGSMLAAQAARNHEHRMLHDSALQTFEAIASGSITDPTQVRRQAEREAAILRRALRQDVHVGSGLMDRLAVLSSEFAEKGLRVEIVSDELEAEPSPTSSSALCDAAREALANVVKHAGVDRAVVRVSDEPEGVTITIRDAGKGFDPSTSAQGFGLENSIQRRMTEIGGWSTIESSPGEGTRVELGVKR